MLQAAGWPLPRGVALTGVMIVIGVSAGAFVRGLKAPRIRSAAELGLLATLVAAGLAVAAVLQEERDGFMRVALAASALVAGFAHSVYYGYAPLPSTWKLTRAATSRAGLVAGLVVSAAFALPTVSWLALLAAGCALTVVLIWMLTSSARQAPSSVLRGDEWLPSVRFPCPRCGVVADWGDAVTPCPECGLFVHLEWDPEGGELAQFAPEDPAPGSFARFTCLSCRNEVDWMRGTTVCAVCGKRLRMHWNVHATGADAASLATSDASPGVASD